MKVLMLNYEFPPLGGGSGMANLHILKILGDEKYADRLEIDLISSSVGRFKIEQFAPNIKIHFLDIHKNKQLHHQSLFDLIHYSFKAYFYARRLKKTNHYNFIHAFFGIPCGVLAYLLGLPYIISLRGSDVPFHTPKFKTLDRLIFKRLSRFVWEKANYVIANSNGLKQEALETSINQKIEVITNGIDLKYYQNYTSKQELTTNLKIISVGRLAHHKGQALLIDALSELENVELILVGDGPQRTEFENLVNEKKVQTIFVGKIQHDEVRKHLSEANIFVLPSLNEGMSNAILEAMACALPIISTNVGGAEELVKENGFIVQKNSVSAIKNGIYQYQQKTNLIHIHSKASLELANEFSWENVANQYFDLYLQIKK